MQLTSKAVLLTATQALAVDWKRRLVSEHAGEVCATPAVSAWQAWTNELAAGMSAMPVALNRVQEGWLWEQVIRDDLLKQSDQAQHSPASVRGLSRHACEAYALMQEYRIDVAELNFSGDEADALRRWIAAMHERLADGDLAGRMLVAEISGQLLQHLNKQGVVLNVESVFLAGFDAFTPMQQALLSALQGLGVVVRQVSDASEGTVSRLYVCADVQAKCSHIALRIRTLLQDDPYARIAIVTSDAVKDIRTLKRALNELLMPELRYDPTNSMQAVVMAGDTLSDRPMIRQLLHMLSLAGEFTLSFDDFSTLLFSPWLKGAETERFGRAALEVKFRRQNRHRMSFKSLENSSDVKTLPELLSVIQALAAWKSSKRSANDWVKAVHELLKSSGFVQPASDSALQRDDHELRQMNAFRDVLIALVAVDAVAEVSLTTTLSWSQFLSLLRSGCSEVRLAESAKYNNVVLMPLAQITGLQFDHVLVMGLDEESFPPPVRSYPLLPAALQKKYALPMSHGSVVFEASQNLWAALLHSAPQVEISFARQRDDKELLASSFVAELEAQTCEMAIVQVEALAMEVFDDESEVPLSAHQEVKGGTSIIKNQSACPFRAFVTHRLGIAELGETAPGIEPSSKGSLIHLALEYIWQQLQSQNALAALAENELGALLDAAIAHAWQTAFVVADSRTREYEQKRMRSVLLEWLELELQRPNFKVISIEQQYVMGLPELSEQQFSVQIKADRIDVDELGRKLLIDYKTGVKQSTRKWLVSEADDRIEEPQLPQYALAAALGADDAVAFARLRSGDMSFEGLCGEDMGIKGIVACDGKRSAPEDWQAVLDDWKVYINALAFEFIEGRCDVSPRDANACTYCGFEAICRVDEMLPTQNAGEQI